MAEYNMTVPVLGQHVSVVPSTFGPGLDIPVTEGVVRARPAYPGTVTYVHPSGRWYQVTFDVYGIKECFFVEAEPEEAPCHGGYHLGKRG